MVSFNKYKSDLTEDTLDVYEYYLYVLLIVVSLWFTLLSIILIATLAFKLGHLKNSLRKLQQSEETTSSQRST